MKTKLLPALALIACTKVNSNLPETTAERCAPEIQAVIDSCNAADVVGENGNATLHKAVAEAKGCIGANIKIVCSETDSVKITTFHRW